MRRALLYCDGASSGNPGESGIGVMLTLGDKSYEVSEYIGIATNNVAEYTALIKGLEKAHSLKAQSVEVFTDSELIVKHIHGIYRVKDEKLVVLWQRVIGLLHSFMYYSVSHIPRELNKKADGLAQGAIKEAKKARQ